MRTERKESARLSRRDFLDGAVVAGLVGLAGLAGCRKRSIPPTSTEVLITRRIEVYWIGEGVGGPEVIEIPLGVSSSPGAPVEVKEKTEELAEIAKETLAPYVLGFLEPSVPKAALLLYIDPEKKTAFVSASSIPEKEGEFGQILAVGKYQKGEIVGYPIKEEEPVISEMGRVLKTEKAEEGITFAVVSKDKELGVKASRFPFWPKQELNLESGEWGRVDWQGLLEERGFRFGEGWEILKEPLSSEQWDNFEKSLQKAVKEATSAGKDKGEIKLRINEDLGSPDAYFSLFLGA